MIKILKESEIVCLSYLMEHYLDLKWSHLKDTRENHKSFKQLLHK